MKNNKISSQIATYSIIVLAGVIQAFSIYVFILPNMFSMGGITGLSTMIEYLTNGKFNTGYSVIIFNVPLLVLAFFFFKKHYIVKTIISIVLSSVLLIILPETGVPQYVSSESRLLPALAGGILGGLYIGLMFKLGGSGGGSEIIGGIVQSKLPAYNIAWCIFIMDALIVFISVFVTTLGKELNYILDILIMSLIRMFVSSRVCSSLLEGFKSAVKFEIVTPRPQELGQELVKELHRGVTLLSGKGMYSGAEKGVLICVVSKRQIGTFQRILKNFPDTFAYIMNTKEVFGKGFSIKVRSNESLSHSKNISPAPAKAEEPQGDAE